MGQAVMGTAVRSGENRAVEAAQAAMASPLLEAGAIDGARGILINITGSSSLKLSEVNEASTLIQSAAHEDANIIFGAVLNEEMGEEVKVTVIATGFRDQMPERRARMLSVEEKVAGSVPVVAADNWLSDGPEKQAEEIPQARFMSQDEEETQDEKMFFSSAAPAVATTVTVAPEAAAVLADEQEPITLHGTSPQDDQKEPPYDYGTESPAHLNESAQQEPPALFPESGETDHRDLDVPAFMRRTQF
jgi:cell division protein FtsZ